MRMAHGTAWQGPGWVLHSSFTRIMNAGFQSKPYTAISTSQGVPGLHGGGGGGGREARVLDEDEVAAMRERNGIDTPGSSKRGPVDSGKGVRIQVGDKHADIRQSSWTG